MPCECSPFNILVHASKWSDQGPQRSTEQEMSFGLEMALTCLVDVSECIVTSSNFSFKTISKVQLLNRVDKLLEKYIQLVFTASVLRSLPAKLRKLKRKRFCLFSFALTAIFTIQVC